MKGGDISNETPRVVLVHIDCVLAQKEERAKRLPGLRKPHTISVLDMTQVNRLYMASLGILPTLECFCTDGSDLSRWEMQLDRMNLNPFRYFTTYGSVQDLVDELPYRPSLVGIVDTPERGLRYGSRWIEFSTLVRN